MEWHLAELKMLQALHAAWACPFLDKSLAFVTRLGDHGLAFILLALVLLCIPKTRKLGLGVGIALILDFLLVNLGLKPLAGRIRPYDLGVPLEILVRKPGDFSFPSGHTAAAMAAAVALIPAGKRVFYPMLALACVMNIKRKLGEKNLSWVADLGWLCSICAMYFVVLFLVIRQNVALGPVAGVIGCGFLLVVLFGGMSPDKSFSQGLKAGLADAFTVFLNTISAFGNIMSYIRLFAVGLASLAIAQSFNNMAAGFQGPLIVVGALIMIVGHALNVVMGLLSVVVHGARLNLLEFSGQLGMEWAGIAYHPFKKFDKINK